MMAGNFLKVDVTVPVQEKSVVINWEKCVLCQRETNEVLVDPEKTKCRSNEKEQGLKTIAACLESFYDIGQLSCLPFHVEMTSLDDGRGVLECMRANKAKYHKTCKSYCSTSRLERARKRAMKSEASKEPSPVKTRRQSEPFEKNKCIFCSCPGTWKHSLCKVATKETSSRIIDYAEKLRDGKLLAKLAGATDLIALEAEYHTTCLSRFYNRMRSFQQSASESHTACDELKGYAFAGLIDYMHEVRESCDDNFPVFKMSELARKYGEGLADLGLDVSVHSTRLQERLLDSCPELLATINPGQDTLITFRKDIDATVTSSAARDFDEEALQIYNATKIVRNDIFKHEKTTLDDVTTDCQAKSVPISLQSLVKMILYGPRKVQNDPNEEEERDCDQVISSISQLLYFHAVQRVRKGTVRRHDKRRETPVPIYVAMKIYGETRSKNLIKATHQLGLSISYDRLQSILAEKANAVCYRYHKENVVCPPDLRRGVFTTAAADNIDHDTSSTTAKTSFHGTAISMMQHFEHGDEGIEREAITEELRAKGVADLPDGYAIVKPCFLDVKSGKCIPADRCSVELTDEDSPLNQEKPWLELATQGSEHALPWAAFHAMRVRPSTLAITKTSLLPVFTECAHSVAMMMHAMNIVRDGIKHLNPAQVPVMVVDQPLYAICKQIQYSLPETHGESNFFVFLGGLHIEMTGLRIIGQWLAGSGWDAVLVEAGVTTQGRAESMLRASHVTRTRYAHQVTAAVLYALQKRAFENYSENDVDALSFSEWHTENCRTKPQFRFWDIALKLELTVLQFVRAVRTADYDLYLEAISRLVKWFFALDHVNYSRWLSVHIRDLVQVSQTNPDLAQQFRAGKFVTRKTDRNFSIALDHMHEQLNAQLKGDGGLVGLTENPDALRKWMLAGPELARMVSQFECVFHLDSDSEQSTHHAQSSSAKKNFNKDLTALLYVFEELGNPFSEESTDLYNVDTKRVVPAAVVETVMKIEEAGQEQYEAFVQERLVTCSRRITDKIKLNKYPLFSSSCKPSTAMSKTNMKVAGLKNDCSLFSRLYIACQSRSGDVDEFFRHENQPYPPAISDLGQLRSCKKSDLITCLVLACEGSSCTTAPHVHAKVIDGAAIVHMLKPGAVKNFQEYADKVFLQYLKNECSSGISRIDIVWDRYNPASLKSGTREKRGTGNRTRVTPSTRVPRVPWVSFLRDPENKTELFDLLAVAATRTDVHGVEIVSTYNENVLTSTGRQELAMLQPCNHEEADTRILLHVKEASEKGHSKIMVRTSDTDVLVLCVATVASIDGLDELWVSIGTGNHHKYIAAHAISAALGPEKSTVLPVFHAFSGCDQVSSFNGRGKKTAFDAWQSYPPATDALKQLSAGLVAEAMSGLQAFVVTLYDRTSTDKTVNECRRKLFTRKSRSLEAIPPTLDALTQHAFRAAYQGGLVWGQCLNAHQELPDPSDWGWQRCGDQWEPRWTTLPVADKTLIALIKCGCTKGCTSRCKCKKSNLPCTELCSCGGCVEGDNEDDEYV